MLETLGITLPFFALILCGYVAAWRGVMRGGSARVLNNFVLYFALPALLVRTLGGLPIQTLLDSGFVFTWTIVSLILFISIALLTAHVVGQRGNAAVIQAAAASLGNVGYLGITLVVGLVRDEGTIAVVSMAIMLDLVIIVPMTIAALELLGRTQSDSMGATVGKVLRALLVNPFVISIFLGLMLSLANLSLPTGLDDFLRILGTAAVPTALFAIGVTLYGQPIGAAWMEITTLCIVKLLLHPLAVLAVAVLVFDLPREMAVAATLLAALPIANNVFVIATQFGVRPRVVSSAILTSMLAALLTFNLWASILIPEAKTWASLTRNAVSRASLASSSAKLCDPCPPPYPALHLPVVDTYCVPARTLRGRL